MKSGRPLVPPPVTSSDGAAFVLQCVDTGASLTLTHSDADHWSARLEAPGLSAATSVYAYRGEELAAFLRGVADDWRGWDGEHSWSSLEGEVELRLATDRLGHVTVRVALVPDLVRSWRAGAELMVDAGDLQRLAARAATFVRS